jgi:hypothetical protein
MKYIFESGIPVEFLGETGTACVTLFKKIRPFNKRGVFFFFVCPVAPEKDAVPSCFFKIELVLPVFRPLFGA